MTQPQELQARDLTPGKFAASEMGTVKCGIPRTRAEQRATCTHVHTHAPHTPRKKVAGDGKPQTEQ